jgi:hypothetical protein
MEGFVMSSLIKTRLAAALALAVLAAGPAFSHETTQVSDVALASNPILPFTEGATDVARDADWDCATHSWAVKPALTFSDRWDGQWQAPKGSASGFVWAHCVNGVSVKVLDRATRATPPFVR